MSTTEGFPNIGDEIPFKISSGAYEGLSGVGVVCEFKGGPGSFAVVLDCIQGDGKGKRFAIMESEILRGQ